MKDFKFKLSIATSTINFILALVAVGKSFYYQYNEKVDDARYFFILFLLFSILGYVTKNEVRKNLIEIERRKNTQE